MAVFDFERATVLAWWIWYMHWVPLKIGGVSERVREDDVPKFLREVKLSSEKNEMAG